MKVSIRKRLERLENAASGHPRMPIVLIDVTKMPKADRAAHRAGDVGVLQRYGAPDPAECRAGRIHTIVIDLHSACRDSRREHDDLTGGDGQRL
jgi:hypothetical protein